MIITSITIGGSEYISKIDQENFTLVKETGGRIGTLTFDLYDTHSNIAAIAMGGAVIAYCGATKHFKGTLARVEPQLINETYAVARCLCQDNNALLDSVTVPSETYTAQTDEAIIDDLFSTYLPAISTADVVQVKASVTVTFANKSLRQCLETLRDLTNAEFYVDADDKFQYYDGAAATANIIELQESVATVIEDDSAGLAASPWFTVQASYTESKLADDDTVAGQHYMAPTAVTTVDGTDYVLTVKAKGGERTWLFVQWNITGDWAGVYFNLGNGVVGSEGTGQTGSITEIDTGTYLCRIKATAGTTSTTFQINLASNGSTWIYDGVFGEGAYIYNVDISTGVPFLLDGFTYTRDWQSRANSVTVVGATTTDSGDPPYICDVDALEPGGYYKTDPSWPPDAAGTDHGDTTIIKPSADYGAGNYQLEVALFRMDTSAIPAGATITRAVLKMWPTSATNPANFSIGVEYYAFDGSPAIGDWTSTPSNSAYGYIAGDDITIGAWTEFELTNPNANISKTGYTGFRIHPYKVGAPGTTINVRFSREGTTAPQLLVEWTTSSTISETRTDATSIAAYGTHKRTIYDDKILTAAEAILRADVELDRCANPQEYGTIPFAADGIDRGDVVRIVSGVHRIDADFHLAALTIQWREGIQTNIGQYGLHQPDAIKRLRELSATS